MDALEAHSLVVDMFALTHINSVASAISNIKLNRKIYNAEKNRNYAHLCMGIIKTLVRHTQKPFWNRPMIVYLCLSFMLNSDRACRYISNQCWSDMTFDLTAPKKCIVIVLRCAVVVVGVVVCEKRARLSFNEIRRVRSNMLTICLVYLKILVRTAGAKKKWWGIMGERSKYGTNC